MRSLSPKPGGVKLKGKGDGMTMSIDLEYYTEPDEKGYIRVERMATYGEVDTALREWLGRETILNEMDCFGYSGDQKYEKGVDWRKVELPRRIRWIACYAVQGGSEGHYIHVDFITSDDMGDHKRQLAYLGKTFQGLDHAVKVAGELTRAFYG
jgi:hypothetical protein